MVELIPWVLLSFLILPMAVLLTVIVRRGYKAGQLLAILNVSIVGYAWYRVIWAEQPLIQGDLGLIVSLLGALLIVAAIVIWVIAGLMVMQPAGAFEGNPQTLVTSGPYKFVRYPLYASYWTLVFGVALWHRSIWAVLLTPAFLAVLFIGFWLEKRYILAKNFPELYKQYRRTTSRFFPWWFALILTAIYLTVLVYSLLV